MSVRIRVHEQEPLSEALRRFKKLLFRATYCDAHKGARRARLAGIYVKPGEIRRRKKWRKLLRSKTEWRGRKAYLKKAANPGTMIRPLVIFRRE